MERTLWDLSEGLSGLHAKTLLDLSLGLSGLHAFYSEQKEIGTHICANLRVTKKLMLQLCTGYWNLFFAMHFWVDIINILLRKLWFCS